MVRCKSYVNVDGVEYPIKALEYIKHQGELLALVECKYYTKMENVCPGEAELPEAEKKDYPIESELVNQRDKELKANKGFIIRFQCPFCTGQFTTRKDCIRHYNGKKPGREEGARPMAEISSQMTI